jgi:hypothetical protein
LLTTSIETLRPASTATSSKDRCIGAYSIGLTFAEKLGCLYKKTTKEVKKTEGILEGILVGHLGSFLGRILGSILRGPWGAFFEGHFEGHFEGISEVFRAFSGRIFGAF